MSTYLESTPKRMALRCLQKSLCLIFLAAYVHAGNADSAVHPPVRLNRTSRADNGVASCCGNTNRLDASGGNGCSSCKMNPSVRCGIHYPGYCGSSGCNNKHLNRFVCATCYRGFKYNAAAMTCERCSSNEYQSSGALTCPDKYPTDTYRSCYGYYGWRGNGNTLPECIKQPNCTFGEFISEDSKVKRRTCHACPVGQYQDEEAHRHTACIPCGTNETSLDHAEGAASCMDSSSTTTSTTVTDTTTTSLPLHARCDPRNDVCDEIQGLMCNEDHYECRYGTKKTTVTTVTATTTTVTATTTTTTLTYTSTTSITHTTTTTTDPTILLCGQPGQPECTGAVVCAATAAEDAPTTTTLTLTPTTTTMTGTTTTNTTVFCTSAQDALDNGEASGCAFPTTFTADLVLEEWMIPALRWVETIEGYLIIKDQHYLTSLSSILPNLEEVTSYVQINNCNGLVKNVAGFANLVKVGGNVIVDNNEYLEVLDNRLFPSLAFAGSDVEVHNNGKLTNMSNYLPSLENSTGFVSINSNYKLVTMANVCESLITAGGVVIVSTALTALDSTTGFGNLATNTGTITINYNVELLTINGVFPALTAVASYIMITNHDKLHTVGPARFGASFSPMTMGASFAVSNNLVLADVTGLKGLGCTAVAGCRMSWYNNDKLEKMDVCGVWDSMTGTGPEKVNGDFSKYGSSNVAANCATTAAGKDPTTTTTANIDSDCVSESSLNGNEQFSQVGLASRIMSTQAADSVLDCWLLCEDQFHADPAGCRLFSFITSSKTCELYNNAGMTLGGAGFLTYEMVEVGDCYTTTTTTLLMAITTFTTTTTITTTAATKQCTCADGHVATADRLGCTSNSTTTTTTETATTTITTTLPQPLLCNGTPDPSDCTSKVAVSDCGTILFGSINASSLCPAMCNACGKTNVGNGDTSTEGTNNETDNGKEEAGDSATAKSNVGMIVSIVLAFLLIGIVVAVFALRRKEQGRQRSFTQSRGPPAQNNATFDFEEEAAAAPSANTDGMSDYEEIDENDDTYEQPANAFEEPATQQKPVSQVDDDYDMPNSRPNQYADMGLGGRSAPNRSAVANATYGNNTAPEGALYDEASNSAAAGQGVLYDAASASGQTAYSLAGVDDGNGGIEL